MYVCRIVFSNITIMRKSVLLFVLIGWFCCFRAEELFLSQNMPNPFNGTTGDVQVTSSSYTHVFKISYNSPTLDYDTFYFDLAFPVRCVRNDL